MRKFKKGDKIYHPRMSEITFQVDDIQEIHQHYVCTSSEGERTYVPFFCENQWELVEDTEPKHEFKVGDIIRNIDDNYVHYQVIGIDFHAKKYVCSTESGVIGFIPFENERFWEFWEYYGTYSSCDAKIETSLTERYETLANDYLSEFVKQTGIEDDAPFWVGNDVGGCACVADYFVDYTTIRYVVDGKMSFEDFDEWYCYCNEVKMVDDSLFTPTLEQWCYGEFTRISDERLEYMKKLKKDFEQLVQEEKEKQNT